MLDYRVSYTLLIPESEHRFEYLGLVNFSIYMIHMFRVLLTHKLSFDQD